MDFFLNLLQSALSKLFPNHSSLILREISFCSLTISSSLLFFSASGISSGYFLQPGFPVVQNKNTYSSYRNRHSHQRKCFLMIFFCFATKTGNDIRTDSAVRNQFPDSSDFGHIPFSGISPVHPLQNTGGSTLHRQMNIVADIFITAIVCNTSSVISFGCEVENRTLKRGDILATCFKQFAKLTAGSPSSPECQ